MIFGSSRPRIVIATPMRDLQVSAAHYASCWQFMGDDLGIIDPQILVDDDLVRARSRAVRLFLEETKAEYLLFWDSDVEGSPDALRGMLAEKVDCIAATYPKKRVDRFGVCRDFAVYTEGRRLAYEGCKAKVPAVGLGFMLLHRRLLERLTEEYRESFECDDEGKPTVMLFALIIGPNHAGVRVLFPEDYSFCKRAQTVWMYTGPGSPLAHVGVHTFRGRPEDVHPRTIEDFNK